MTIFSLPMDLEDTLRQKWRIVNTFSYEMDISRLHGARGLCSGCACWSIPMIVPIIHNEVRDSENGQINEDMSRPLFYCSRHRVLKS